MTGDTVGRTCSSTLRKAVTRPAAGSGLWRHSANLRRRLIQIISLDHKSHDLLLWQR
jgi:hypothetical protein